MRLMAMLWLLLCLLLARGGDALAVTSLQDIRAMMRDGELASAGAALEEFLGQHPDDPKARFLKGLVLARQERHGDAIEVFKGLVRDYPELPEPYNNLAVLYAEQGHFDEARDALLRAIGTHPSYATAHENLGDIYARMAASAYDKALTLDAGNATAEAKLALVNELFPATADEGGGGAMPAAATAGGDQARVAKELLLITYAWANAWSARDAEAYLGYYAAGYEPAGGTSRQAWAAERRRRVKGPEFIEIEIDEPRVVSLAEDAATVRFVQSYRSDSYRDQVLKTLDFVREGGEWKIVRERSTVL